jgi:hypothetical protein
MKRKLLQYRFQDADLLVVFTKKASEEIASLSSHIHFAFIQCIVAYIAIARH